MMTIAERKSLTPEISENSLQQFSNKLIQYAENKRLDNIAGTMITMTGSTSGVVACTFAYNHFYRQICIREDDLTVLFFVTIAFMYLLPFGLMILNKSKMYRSLQTDISKNVSNYIKPGQALIGQSIGQSLDEELVIESLKREALFANSFRTHKFASDIFRKMQALD